MRTSQSFSTLTPLSRVGPKRPGRGAKLPQVPQGGMLPPLQHPHRPQQPNDGGANSRRNLPHRDGYYSRSLENDPTSQHHQQIMGPPGEHHPQQHQKLDTVLEAGRGVRKLPVPIVKTGTGRNNGMMNGGGGPMNMTNHNGISVQPHPQQQQQQQQMPGTNTAYDHMIFEGDPQQQRGPGPGPMGPPPPMGGGPPPGPHMPGGGMGPPMSQQQQQPRMQETMVNQGMVGPMPTDINQMPNWT